MHERPRSHFDHFLNSAIVWAFRRRSPALVLVRIGATIIALVLIGWAFHISIPTPHGALSMSFDTSSSTPADVTYSAIALGVLLIVVGVLWEWHRYRQEERRIARKKVIVIEARGLRDTSGTPLLGAVPQEIEGHRDQILVDLRQRVRDGVIIDPAAALEKLQSLPVDLARHEGGLDRRDITTVYGGLTPVPLTFLTGVLIDDEGVVVIMDWDRHAGSWRPLSGDDDGKRFVTSGMPETQNTGTEAVLAVSVSYRVDVEAVRRQFTGIPLVHMELEDGSPDCHWSELKQGAIGKQFLETAIALGNVGVRRLHIIIAAQNSIAFRFGRLYDKRNLPQAIVYQYERDNTPSYPWGVLMPVAGIAGAIIIHATLQIKPRNSGS